LLIFAFVGPALYALTAAGLYLPRASPRFSVSSAGVRRAPRRRGRPTPRTHHGSRASARGHVERGDYEAELAERYGWINRALRAAALGDFVRSLAYRIAGFPAAGHAVVKDRVNAIALAPVEDFRRDSDLFGEGMRNPEGAKSDAGRDEARFPDPRRGNCTSPDAGRRGRPLIEHVA